MCRVCACVCACLRFTVRRKKHKEEREEKRLKEDGKTIEEARKSGSNREGKKAQGAKNGVKQKKGRMLVSVSP